MTDADVGDRALVVMSGMMALGVMIAALRLCEVWTVPWGVALLPWLCPSVILILLGALAAMRIK